MSILTPISDIRRQAPNAVEPRAPSLPTVGGYTASCCRTRLTPRKRMCDNTRMEEELTLTDMLREHLRKAPSLRRISKETGVIRDSLQRFRDERQSLRLDHADKLAAYFGIQFKQTKRKGG